MQVNTAITATNPRRCNKKKNDKYTMPGACFSKVPKLFGRISGGIILFVSSKRRRLEARNFAVILIFIPFTTYEKTSFTEKAGRSFTNGFSGPKSSRDFRETCPWSQTFYERKKSRIKTNPSFVGFYSNLFPQLNYFPSALDSTGMLI